MVDTIEVIDLIDDSDTNTNTNTKISDSNEIIEIVDSEDEYDITTDSLMKTSKTSEISESSTDPKSIPSYYQRAFNSILSTVIEVYYPILSEEELNILNCINGGLSMSAQKLFIRLILRKVGWHRSNKLVYEDIPNVTEALQELNSKQLCTVDSEDIMYYLELFTLNELKSLATTKLFLKIASVQREEIIRLILNSKPSGQQRISFGSTGKLTTFKSNSSTSAIIRQISGSIIKICDHVRQLIDTAISLYFLVSESEDSSQESLSTAILVEIKRRSYPKYKIVRVDPIFKTRNDYMEYQKALELEINLKEQEIEDVTIFELVEEAKRNLILCLHNCDMKRSYFLRRYTAGWVYCRILGHLAATLESVKRYNLAVEIFRFLLDQNLFCLGHRGRWWERSVLDTSKHLKDSKKAIELCEEALKDTWLRTSALTSIRRRLKKLNKNEVISDSGDSINYFEEDEPEMLTIQGRIQDGNVTGKKVKLHLDGDDLSLGTVEEFVLNEFARDGWDGVHSESSYFTTIFSLLFWDLLFEIQVPDVFQTAYQTGPLDLNTDAFYPQRAESIELRLKMIEENFEDAIKLIKKHHITNHKVTCVGVNWTDYSGEDGIEILIKIARGIGGMALSLILRQFCEDYRHNRSGMPDLILWRRPETSDEPSRLIDHANGIVFAEVKSPNDRVSDAQRHWFSVLKNGGLRVLVVRVNSEGENKRARK